MFLVVEETQRSLIDYETYSCLLAGGKLHLPETFQFLDRTRQARFLVGDIELHNLATLPAAGILHIDRNGDDAVGGNHRFIGGRFAIFESSVAQSMTEREKRCGLLFVGPAVANENIVIVEKTIFFSKMA